LRKVLSNPGFKIQREELQLTDVDPDSTAQILAKLENIVRDDTNKTNEDIKDIYSGLTKYGKAIEKVIIYFVRSNLFNAKTKWYSEIQ